MLECHEDKAASSGGLALSQSRHTTLAFSLPLDHQCSSNSLQHLAYSYINISYINILSLSQQYHSTLHHFRIHLWATKLRKQLY
jgi:hypothetical protein